MRILFWNIRAGGGKRIDGILAQIQAWEPDIVALAEFRGTPASQQLAQNLADAGWCHQLDTVEPTTPAKNALCLAAKWPLTRINHPTAPTEPNRWLLASLDLPDAIPNAPPCLARTLTLGIMHIPNYVTKRKYPYHDAVLATMDTWGYGPGLLVGDTNTGKQLLDEEVPCFNVREHAWMEAIEARGWCDAFRHLHGEERVYTWYSPNGKNGFRLDEAFIHPELMPMLHSTHYVWGHNLDEPTRRDGLSDHAALLVELSF